MSLRMSQVKASLLAMMLVILPLMLGALLPKTAQAQGACALSARLKVGDAVEVISGAANRLRAGPGLSYGKLAINVKPGEVWYVQGGPVCADGINWYRVAAYDAEGWTAEGQVGAGYYLGRTNRSPQEGAAASCASRRLKVGMVVAVSDGVRQRVHREARKSSPQTAWLYPNAPVTLVKGPVCADGWVWWYISGDGGRLAGWTSEGDGAKAWLAPVAAGQGKASSGVGAGAAIAPTLVGTAQVEPARGYAAIFSPDRQAFSLFYDDFIVQATDSQPSVRREERVVLPVRSGANGYRARATLGATLHCDPGSRITVTFQVGPVAKTMTCTGTHDGYLTVDAVQSANADLALTITAQANRYKPGAYAVVNIDLIDLSISPR